MTSRLLAGSKERLLTIADIAALPNELPSGPVQYELEKGKLLIMAPPGDLHAAVENTIAGYLFMLGQLKGHGEARCGEIGIVLSDGKTETLYGADSVFIGNDRLPVQRSSEGYLKTVPHIVAEVRSKNDSPKRVVEKIETYLKAGVELVWDIDPTKKVVIVHRPRKKPQTLAVGDCLTANAIIPDFRVKVAQLFPK